MSGRRKSLAENQGDIGTYFSVNKNGTYLENEGTTTGRKQGENNSQIKDLRILTPSQSTKRPRAPSHSPTEQRKGNKRNPLKQQTRTKEKITWTQKAVLM